MAEVSTQMKEAIVLNTEKGVQRQPLWRITGWPNGIPFYRWMDNTHLLIFATLSEEYGPPLVLPMVIDLSNGETWLPATDNPTYIDSAYVFWSEGLQTLISKQGSVVFLYDANGGIVQRFDADARLQLSPSGQRLFDGFAWRDPKADQVADFGIQNEWGMWVKAWSFDETRLFGGWGKEFAFADVRSGKYSSFRSNLSLVDGEGFNPEFRWVLDDTRIMVEAGFSDYLRDENGVIALIDPENQSYLDVRALTGLDPHVPCYESYIAPDGEHIWIGCSKDSSYIVDLRTFITQTIPGDYSDFCSWSPDSQFALLVHGGSSCTHFVVEDFIYYPELPLEKYALFPLAGGDLYPLTEEPVIGPTWNPKSDRLAYLTEDGYTLVVLDAATKQSVQIPLPYPITAMLWRPQGDKLLLVADDRSLWWTSDLAKGNVEQLTRPLARVGGPDVYIFDVQWSPDCSRIAYVNEPDVYVVSVTGD